MRPCKAEYLIGVSIQIIAVIPEVQCSGLFSIVIKDQVTMKVYHEATVMRGKPHI